MYAYRHPQAEGFILYPMPTLNIKGNQLVRLPEKNKEEAEHIQKNLVEELSRINRAAQAIQKRLAELAKGA